MEAFEVQPSAIQGLGAFAARAIARRKKIGHLTGPLISTRTARRRTKTQEQIYLVELDERWALDLTNSSGLKHLNHSCAPNAYMRIAWQRVEFYALRNIKRGEELTCDYGETHHAGKLPCRCGAPNCRGWI
jgi:SET domain-containing protein